VAVCLFPTFSSAQDLQLVSTQEYGLARNPALFFRSFDAAGSPKTKRVAGLF
jgi:hypothetical protein